jgi:hypothetical protein
VTRDPVRDFPITWEFRHSEEWRRLVRRATGRPDPIGVGGVGGSGTRLASEILEAMGLDPAPELGPSRDSYAWPRFELTLHERMPERAKVSLSFWSLEVFARARDESHRRTGRTTPWFWKVPTTFIWLDYLAEYFPELRYIHMIRHGLDMAFARNTRQARLFGPHLGVAVDAPPSPVQLLDYWIAANRYALTKARALLDGRYFVLSYDALCAEPERTLKSLMDFLRVPRGATDIGALAGSVRGSSGIRRFRSHDCLGLFGPERLEAVRSFGFAVE